MGKISISCRDFQDKYSGKDLEALNMMHTKQLLNERNRLYYISEFCADCHDNRDPECQTCYANSAYNKQQLKQILDTREHVPNKQESKALRKERIKRGK